MWPAEFIDGRFDIGAPLSLPRTKRLNRCASSRSIVTPTSSELRTLDAAQPLADGEESG